MRSFPIIHRELQMASRRPATYRQRTLVGGFAAASIVLSLLFNPSFSAQSGRALFHIVTWIAFIAAILEGLRETADSLAQERREGTLGLLFLTDLRVYDVLLGKLFAAGVKSFSTLLAAIPAIALPLWLGGVTAGECVRVAAALAAALLLSMTAGILLSATNKSAFVAFLGGFLLIVTLMLFPVACISSGIPVPGWMTGPVAMFQQALDVAAVPASDFFGVATFYSMTLCGLLFWISGIALLKILRAEPDDKVRWWQRWSPKLTSGKASVALATAENPAEWIAGQMMPGRQALWLLIAVLAVVSFLIGGVVRRNTIFILFAVQIAFSILIKLWISVVAAQPFNLARRTGELELLLCTPLSADRLVKGHMDALRHYYTTPLLIAAFSFMIAGSLGSIFFHHDILGAEMVPSMLYGMLWFLFFLFDLSAVGYTALWFGLTEPHISRAIGRTVFRVLILPVATLLIPWLGLVGLVIWPWFWMAWASKKLNQRFQEEAASHFSMAASRSST